MRVWWSAGIGRIRPAASVGHNNPLLHVARPLFLRFPFRRLLLVPHSERKQRPSNFLRCGPLCHPPIILRAALQLLHGHLGRDRTLAHRRQ